MTDRTEEIQRRSLETEGKILRCRRCGKTPQDIGWCDQCGYNRDYELVQGWRYAVTHTPGPWIVTKARGTEDEICFHEIRDAEHITIASTWAGPHEANARLIARAPNMLAALRVIADWDKAPLTHEHPGALIDVIRCICDRAREEITKATQP